MYTPVYTKQFARDVKKAQKRGKNLEKFKIIATTLLHGETLDEIHRDHKLLGNYSGRRECHIEADWLVIYKTIDEKIIFERMGSHSDLFRK
jgi:mRNA interferase YafQ